jgi:CheY-like chemotaxis protein
MLLEPGVNELVGEDVQTIQSALKRANELTRQLGTFSSGGFGRPQRVRFATRIERLLPVIKGLIGEGVELQTRIAARLPAIRIDPNQLDQLLMNLVVNARDAMTTEGRLEVELSEVTLSDDFVREHPRLEAGRYLRFVVTDTGHGMDEDVRRKIFEPYFTTKRDRGGTGLGLASVYWAVSQAGGHIEVASVVGKGTSFTIFLPVDRQGAAHGVRAGSSRRRKTILVVDSDLLAARQLEGLLADLGHRVITAGAGSEALAVLRDRADIALVITDVVLHGMNGRELARELRLTNERLPVLLMTGAENDVLERVPEGEEIQVLTKPVSKDALSRKLADLLPEPEPPDPDKE